MKETYKHLLALTVSVLYTLLVYFSIGICFSTNDDRFMGELLSGAITGNIETHLVYVNYLLSLPLSLLYRISTNVAWFGILLVFLHVFSCYCILDSFYSKAKNKVDLLIGTFLTCLLFLTELYLISQISYTMTAAFMAVAGYVCLLLNDEKKIGFIYFILLELLSFLLRDKAMLMIQPLGFAVFFGFSLIKKNTSFKEKMLPPIKTVATLICIFIIGFVGTNIGYHNDNWQTYKQYNDARTTIFDYSEFPPYEEVSHILGKYSIDETDYIAYEKYSILDYKLNLDCVKELADYMASKEQTPSVSELVNSFKTATFFEQYWQTNTVLIIGWICAILFMFLSGNFRGYIPLSFLFLARTTIWFYLLYEGRFPLRVSMPLFACELVLLVTIVFYFHLSKIAYKNWKKVAYIGIGALFCTFSLWSAKIQFVNFRTINTGHQTYMEGFFEVLDYCNANPTNKYILDTLSFVWYNGEALDGRLYGERNCISAGCWFANAPTLLQKNAEYFQNTEDGFYFIMFSESEDTNEELNHPIVLYLAKESGSVPQISDAFTASHGGTYSVLYFNGQLDINLNP